MVIMDGTIPLAPLPDENGPKRGILRSASQPNVSTDSNASTLHPLKPKLDRRKSDRAISVSAGRRKSQDKAQRRSISFHEKHDERLFQKLPEDSFSELFYDHEEIAEMRHRAFMEDCGLDPDAEY